MRESGRRSQDHRLLHARRHALHDQVPVGAGRRCARRAGAVAAARPPARLAGVLAASADGGDRVSWPSAIPPSSPWLVAFGALLVATASATQDIVIDAFRVESLDENEQAAGMASYVAAYRIGMLASTAGALFLVSGFEGSVSARTPPGRRGYIGMAALVAIGIVTTLVATEPEKSAAAAAEHAAHARRKSAPARRGRRLRRVRRIPHPRRGDRRARFRGALQILRRVRRRHDRAVRHRHRLLPQRLCHHRQGRRARRHSDRRLRRRRARARLSAGRPACGSARSCRWLRTWSSPGRRWSASISGR